MFGFPYNLVCGVGNLSLMHSVKFHLVACYIFIVILLFEKIMYLILFFMVLADVVRSNVLELQVTTVNYQAMVLLKQLKTFHTWKSCIFTVSRRSILDVLKR